MYIKTRSKEEMEQSVCDYLEVDLEELSKVFKEAKKEGQKDMDEVRKVIDYYIDSMTMNKELDRIQFFHLSRRLNSEIDCHTGKNLYDLLSTESPIKIFLSKHGVEFIRNNGHFDLKYKGEKVSLEVADEEDKESLAEFIQNYNKKSNKGFLTETEANADEGSIPYLRWRLGHDKKDVDYCFNGFMMRDLLYNNDYKRRLHRAPEFIQELAKFLKCSVIETDYSKNSKYFCYEYCVPIDEVIFDAKEDLSYEGKQQYVIKQTLYRLYYYYKASDINDMHDNENPMLRLKDDATMKEEYFVAKEEIIL